MNLPPIDIPRLLRALGIGRAMSTDPPRVYVVEEPLPYDLFVIDGPLVELDPPTIERRGNVVNISVAGKVRPLGGRGFTVDPGHSLITDGLLDMDAVRAAGDLLDARDPLGIVTGIIPSLPSPEEQERASRALVDSIRQMMRIFSGPWYVTMNDQDLADRDAYLVLHDSLDDARQLAESLNEHVEDNGSDGRYRHRIYVLKYLEG